MMTVALGKVAGKLHHTGTYGARGKGMTKCCIRQYDTGANCSEERAMDESSRRVVAIVAQAAASKGSITQRFQAAHSVLKKAFTAATQRTDDMGCEPCSCLRVSY